MNLRLSMTLLLLTSAAAAYSQQPAPVPTTQYTDAASGMTLEYPSVWKRTREPITNPGGNSYLFANMGVKTRFLAVFSPKGNYYEKTTLDGLDFFYGSSLDYSAEGCRKLVAGDGGSSQVTIHGVPYTSSEGGDGGAGSFIEEKLYSTFRGSTCYFFEGDMFYNDRLGYGNRMLTEKERAALKRHLDAIMQTVRFPDKP